MNAWQDILSAWNLIWSQQTAGLVAPPWALALILALITLLVEDVAIAAGAALAAAGLMSWPWAFVGVAGGIAAGDIGLYGLGAGAHRAAWLQRRWLALSARQPEAVQRWQTHLNQQLASAVLLARVIPGLRLLTYTACGWLRIDLLRFSLWCGFAVAIWTGGLFYISATLGAFVTQHTGLPPALAAALPVLALAIGIPLIRHLRASPTQKDKHEAA